MKCLYHLHGVRRALRNGKQEKNQNGNKCFLRDLNQQPFARQAYALNYTATLTDGELTLKVLHNQVF